MNSKPSGFVLSQLAGDARGRYRLHSRLFTLHARVFAALSAMGAFFLLLYAVTVAAERGLSELAGSALLALLTLALAALVWSRPKSVFATEAGLEVGSGKKLRLIPWSRVLNVRELPWIRGSLSWHPRMWQVDLDRDERFDFYGSRKAREIVTEYVKQADSRAARSAH
ncbi:MAG: hypothetical protein ABW061_29435 [Polyangiaceae bacterium]